jgi:hypothetical protein
LACLTLYQALKGKPLVKSKNAQNEVIIKI